MKKALSNTDNDEMRAEYDLKALGPGVIGKYAHLRTEIWPEQIQEEARLVARREVMKQVEELRSEDKKLRKELQLMKKQLDRIERAGQGGKVSKDVKKPRPALEKKSA